MRTKEKTNMEKKNRNPHPLIAQAKREIEVTTSYYKRVY
jgi:hypothetical protein